MHCDASWGTYFFTYCSASIIGLVMSPPLLFKVTGSWGAMAGLPVEWVSHWRAGEGGREGDLRCGAGTLADDNDRRRRAGSCISCAALDASRSWLQSGMPDESKFKLLRLSANPLECKVSKISWSCCALTPAIVMKFGCEGAAGTADVLQQLL